ncbi:DNA replication factor Dna2-domain-containing protein [Aspergillus californicus]
MVGQPRPIPASETSRSKLNAFRYKDKDGNGAELPSMRVSPQQGHENKENQTSWLNGVMEQDGSKADREQPAAEVKTVNECPQTPGNRLPLADLIGNAEDAFSRAPVGHFTPEDYVIWQHVPASSNPSTQTPATQSKKRRHSSSPSSSPLAGSKGAKRESFDLKSIQTLLKTPQNDLATDLWNSYVAKTTTNVSDLQQPRLANLISSSPHTPMTNRTGQDSSGLRRSNSCNAEWPSSKAKRRKIEGESHPKGRAIFSRTRSNIMVPRDSKASNFRSLIKEMERSLQKVPPKQPDPAPVPAHHGTRRSRSASPLAVKVANTIEAEVDLGDDLTAAPSAPESKETSQRSSSDFGDDDLDDDFLELADASMDSFVEQNQTDNTFLMLNAKHESRTVKHSFGDVTQDLPPKTNKKVPTETDYTLEHDEFDDDFEGFSDNIDEILAGCDATPSSKISRNIQQQPRLPEYSLSHNGTERLPEVKEESHNETKKQYFNSGDEFDEDDFDMDCLDQPITQTGEDSPDDNYRGRKAIKRYLIVDIAESTYAAPKGRIQQEKVLSVQDEITKRKKVIILQDSWYDSPCDKDSYVHLIGDFNMAGHCIVNDAQNMIIIHPDHLISATVIADSISCQRRAVLQDRIKRTSDIGKPQVFGNIFHELFQEAMKLNMWDTASLKALTEEVAVRHVEELYLIHMSLNEAVDHVMGRIPGIQRWAELFLRSKPGAQSFVEDRNSSKLKLSVSKLLEVEEHVWSPMYGLKGNIDATVQVSCSDGDGDKSLVVPLELKTGNKETNQAHRAQTALYTLLLSDRYGKHTSWLNC